MPDKIIFFGNKECPYCIKVLKKMKEKKVDIEFNEVPIDRNVRGSTRYRGKVKELEYKNFEDIFNGNISIPKMIMRDWQKLMDSDEMMKYLESL